MSNRISPGPGQPYLTCPSCELEQVWQDVNYQCDGNPNNPSGMNGHMDARGVTYWRGDTNQYTLSPNNEYGTNQYSQKTIQFTCTQPRCYQNRDACIIFFRSYVSDNTDEDPVPIQWLLNGYNYGRFLIVGNVGAEYGNYQATDVGNLKVTQFLEAETNTFTIRNMSQSATVIVDSIQIANIYGMCGLNCDCQDLCDGSSSCDPGNSPCRILNWNSSNGDFTTRVDCPCNLNTGNGTRGYTYYLDKYFTGEDSNNQNNPSNYSVIEPGGSLQWNFDFSGDSQYIYVEKSICFFNFNNILLTEDEENDVELWAYLNNDSLPFAKYHLSKLTSLTLPTGQYYGNIFPSFDLTTLSSYNDAGSNHVRLVNTSTTESVKMSSGNGGDGINIYRIYVEYAAASCPCGACQTECQSCYVGQGCGICNACYVGCEICQPCEDCQACQESCQTSCYITCQPSCYMCQTACELGCLSCQSCYGTCEFCNATCEECMVTCQGCEPGFY